jgi:hypothetical protein
MKRMACAIVTPRQKLKCILDKEIFSSPYDTKRESQMGKLKIRLENSIMDWHRECARI